MVSGLRLSRSRRWNCERHGASRRCFPNFRLVEYERWASALRLMRYVAHQPKRHGVRFLLQTPEPIIRKTTNWKRADLFSYDLHYDPKPKHVAPAKTSMEGFFLAVAA